MNGPNFFIIGAAKAATTSLASLLAVHPEAGMAKFKEPHFFSVDSRYKAGWQRYSTLYYGCQGKKAIGEASTSYSRIRYHPQVVDRIKEHVPHAKIIYMVRHPLERMESAYLEHLCIEGAEVFSSINDAIRQMPIILDSSRYWEVFAAYRERFGESKIKIVWFEEYIADTTAVFQDVCRFLEIDDIVIPDRGHELKHSREDAAERLEKLGRGNLLVNTTWDEATRSWVISQIREDNTRLLAHFSKPKNYWGELF